MRIYHIYIYVPIEIESLPPVLVIQTRALRRWTSQATEHETSGHLASRILTLHPISNRPKPLDPGAPNSPN